MVLQERVPPRTRYKGFYLEPLKVSAERWAEEPVKVLLRIFHESVLKHTQKFLFSSACLIKRNIMRLNDFAALFPLWNRLQLAPVSSPLSKYKPYCVVFYCYLLDHTTKF